MTYSELDDEIDTGNIDLTRIAFHLWLREAQQKLDSLPVELRHEFCIRLLVRYFINNEEK